MIEHTNQPSQLSSLIKLLGIFVAILCFTLIGQAAVVALLAPLHNYDAMDAINSLQRFDNRFELLLAQGISAIFTFILGPLAFGWKFDRSFIKQLRRPSIDKQQYLLAIIIMAIFLPLGGLILYWNQNIQFPESMSALEGWFKSKEIHLAEVTAYIVDFDSFWEFLFGLVVIALLAGIGEEIVFRGFIQRYFEGIFQNVHAGIWLSAFFFSFIHLQFYGFFVRLLMGVLLGYLFLWSGRSLYPCILAHITNNAITVISVYLNKEEYLPEMRDPFSAEAPEWYIVAIFTVLAFGLLYYYKNIGSKLRNT
ncbi:CPBP family intramembrane metalloprotease [Flammeovirga yaeyamensis]|uniref:CPBP family intramembrane metalloprotease n=1 Tax=Flammeovirga yaeyamensis TaxID=367791 RepID=A0AAX1N7T3_9BACT|nr:type II CAAX endopeptidase family protein [Flammeovirga yaeyamensis]MBB3700404.1 hypothetical protein [Flammeovirga yaeyamensis]NMF36970.1 CPBP family intramembrane metalloprotease [Flammeovirga yaeyamensis]QWG02486.1 CPBP family intramembrane metalloprotease [Flammeovirga yaeyamensis]